MVQFCFLLYLWQLGSGTLKIMQGAMCSCGMAWHETWLERQKCCARTIWDWNQLLCGKHSYMGPELCQIPIWLDDQTVEQHFCLVLPYPCSYESGDDLDISRDESGDRPGPSIYPHRVAFSHVPCGSIWYIRWATYPLLIRFLRLIGLCLCSKRVTVKSSFCCDAWDWLKFFAS